MDDEGDQQRGMRKAVGREEEEGAMVLTVVIAQIGSSQQNSLLCDLYIGESNENSDSRRNGRATRRFLGGECGQVPGSQPYSVLHHLHPSHRANRHPRPDPHSFEPVRTRKTRLRTKMRTRCSSSEGRRRGLQHPICLATGHIGPYNRDAPYKAFREILRRGHSWMLQRTCSSRFSDFLLFIKSK